jgi:hypothetical protein
MPMLRVLCTTMQCFDVLTSLKKVQTFLLQSLHTPGLRDCALAALLGVCHSSGALEFELDLVSVLLDLEDAAATTIAAAGAGATAGVLSAADSGSSDTGDIALSATDVHIQFAQSSSRQFDNSAAGTDTAADGTAADAETATDSNSTPAVAVAAAVPLLQGAAAAGLHAFVREVAAETARRRCSVHIADSSDSSTAAAGTVTDASFDAAKSSAYVQLSEAGLVAASSDSGNRLVDHVYICCYVYCLSSSMLVVSIEHTIV